MQITDIIIVGGGASGLAAAIAAKRCCPNLEVTILERNARIGKKLLVTGNGRCNLGNNENMKSSYRGTLTKLLPHIFSQTQDAETFFQSMGLYCRQESNGRLYPYSNQAATVLDALRFTVEQAGVLICSSCAVTALHRKKNYFEVDSQKGKIAAKAVIVATGGLAAPKTGSDGAALTWLFDLGHCFSNCKPALVPFYTDPCLVHPLKGVRISAKVSAWSEQKKLLAEDIGEVQFTERTLSGICVMNLSACCTQEEPTEISLCLLPELSEDQLKSLLWEIYASRAAWKLEDWLTGLFPKKVSMQLIRTSGIALSFDTPVYHVMPSQLEQLAKICQTWRFPVISRGSWQEAQVTSGGIPANEVDVLLQSQKNKGLFFAGEILDLHGNCGGYNLNWAWQSGQYAGQNAAQLVQMQRKGARQHD